MEVFSHVTFFYFLGRGSGPFYITVTLVTVLPPILQGRSLSLPQMEFTVY